MHDDINIHMPEKNTNSDYLQFALEQIVKEISELKTMLSDNSKTNLEFRDAIIARVTALELRLNTLETEKKVLSGVLGSKPVQYILKVLAIMLAVFVGGHSDAILTALKSFL